MSILDELLKYVVGGTSDGSNASLHKLATSEDIDIDDNPVCRFCGADLSLGYPAGDGCMNCIDCAGEYAPGSEECDWCPHDKECAELSA